MRKIYLLLLALFTAVHIDAQIELVSVTAPNDTISCTNYLRISCAIGQLPETSGDIYVDWGDGSMNSYNFTTSDTIWVQIANHLYMQQATYNVTVITYSETAGDVVDTTTISWQAIQNDACGKVNLYTFSTSPSMNHYNVPFDFTGADGTMTTLYPSGNYTYVGLDIDNAPYTASVNDAWLTANNKTQITPDYTFSFNPDGWAFSQDIQLGCTETGVTTDLSIPYGFAYSFIAPLQTGHISFNLCNYECGQAADGEISVTFTPGLVPQTAGLLNASVTGNVLTYTIEDITGCAFHDILFTVPGTIPAGTEVEFTVSVSSPDDTNTANNSDDFSTFVFNSYDPNDKSVNHGAHISPASQETLEYLVNFQNEGNYPAVNVVVRDTLSELLDLSTFKLLRTKHPVAVTIDETTREAVFTFRDINLAPSEVSEEASKGYIVYSITEKANLATNTFIYNTAYIYFDYNPAIITNTTSNQNYSTLGVEEEQQRLVTVYPNPTEGMIRFAGEEVSHVVVTDLSGKKVFEADLTDDKMTLNNMDAGVYTIYMTTSKGTQIQPLIMR